MSMGSRCKAFTSGHQACARRSTKSYEGSRRRQRMNNSTERNEPQASIQSHRIPYRKSMEGETYSDLNDFTKKKVASLRQGGRVETDL